jgi:predicted transcriptional regulator of viral defense system
MRRKSLVFRIIVSIDILHFNETEPASKARQQLRNSSPGMHAREYIDALASRGRYHFSLAEAVSALALNPLAVRAQLRRLKKVGLVAEPSRSFLVIVPSEYRHLGCLPAEQFVPHFMARVAEPYYFALLSAAQRHGAAHQSPQAAQVMVRTTHEALTCGKVHVRFIARADMIKMPVLKVNSPRGSVQYSTPEVTALELVGYPREGGGLDNVATVLAELAEAMTAAKLVAAAQLCPESWAQRLGYLLELVGHPQLAASLNPLASRAQSYTPLRRLAATAGATRSKVWKLIINVKVEPDL